MRQKIRALILAVLSFATLLVACARETPKEPEYTTNCTVYFTSAGEGTDIITSVDLDPSSYIYAALEVMIKSDIIHTFVRQKYPEIEYDYRLEQVKDTCMAQIVVISTSQKYVADICNLIAKKLCEVVDTSLDNITIKVISVAKKPTKPN